MYIERNYPFRGQKSEVYEGGVRVAAFVHSPLLPDKVRGTTLHDIAHVTDWVPSIVAATGASLDSRRHPPLDGVDMWGCIMGSAPCRRKEVVLNIDTECNMGCTEKHCPGAPAPKAAMRIGELKIMAECFDINSMRFKGRASLFNLTADPGETTDLAATKPDVVEMLLSTKLLPYAKEAAQIPPFTMEPPWQGEGYYCAKCSPGKPLKMHGKPDTLVWDPWCKGEAGVVC